MNANNTETNASQPPAPQRKRASMFVRILLVFAGLIAAFLVFVAMKPADFRVTRSIKMAASPEQVFPQVNTLQSWEGWSPWAKLDPNATLTYQGPPAGVGASYSWKGNSEVGEGTSTITESHPHDLVKFKLEFKQPFEDTSIVEFTFQPEGEQTVVTWSMSGRSNFMGKLVCTFMNMDKMVGGKFEEGLASMKAIVEGAEKK